MFSSRPVSGQTAFVVFPGGFGTLDEMMEVLTLVQTERITKKMVVVLYGEEFWSKVLNLDALVETGMISPQDLGLFKVVKTVDEAFAAFNVANYPGYKNERVKAAIQIIYDESK